jgi:hypothetical protein
MNIKNNKFCSWINDPPPSINIKTRLINERLKAAADI